MERKKVREVKLKGGLVLGNDKIYVQSMLNKNPLNIEENVNQAIELEKAHCDIIRVSIPNHEALKLIPKLKENVKTPIVCDIHFDYKLAIESVMAGADKIRINPSNIGDIDKIKEVVKACSKENVPIRVGVNSGSIEKPLLKKYKDDHVKAMVESALKSIKLLNRLDFYDIVVSVKSSSVQDTIRGYKLLSKKCDYPLHLGVTESGDETIGKIKSAIGIGSLLCCGIGNTIRVSLTGSPIEEVYAAYDILRSLNLLENEIDYISCPTCGRTSIDLIKLNKEIKDRLKDVHKPIKVAIMGCVVNGPGEAKDADIGIAGGEGSAVLFKHGQVIKKLKEEEIVDALVYEIEKM